MNEHFTYDPEDLESLLMHKTFADLYPEEKIFVLKHMDSEEEYASMRDTLLTVQATADNDSNLTMPASSKATLMDAFKEERKRGAWFTLNGLFALLLPPQKPWYGKPAFQLATVGLLLFVGASFFNVFSPESKLQFADAKTEELEDIKTAPKQEIQSASKEFRKEETATAMVEDESGLLEETEKTPNTRAQSKDQNDSKKTISKITQNQHIDSGLRDDEINWDLDQADVLAESEKENISAGGVTPNVANVPTEDSFLDADGSSSTALFNSPTTTAANVPTEITVTAEKVEFKNSEDEMLVANAEDLSDVMTLLEAAY